MKKYAFPDDDHGLILADQLALPELESVPVLFNSIGIRSPGDAVPSEWKSIYQMAFGRYLRTGRLVSIAEGLAEYERKFNANHDKRGRFTFSPAGAHAKKRPHKTPVMSAQQVKDHPLTQWVNINGNLRAA